jgi:hypothetical protein
MSGLHPVAAWRSAGSSFIGVWPSRVHFSSHATDLLGEAPRWERIPGNGSPQGTRMGWYLRDPILGDIVWIVYALEEQHEH